MITFRILLLLVSLEILFGDTADSDLDANDIILIVP